MLPVNRPLPRLHIAENLPEWSKRLIEELNLRLSAIGTEVNALSVNITIMTDQLGFIDIGQYSGILDAPAPGDNVARLYVRDNGAGKEELIVRFSTGAVAVLATEP